MSPLPSVDALLRRPEAALLVARFGRSATVAAIRGTLEAYRADGLPAAAPGHSAILTEAADALAARFSASQRPVFNLTGTVLHTNLGRAPLPQEAADAIAQAALLPTTLEYDLATGTRGERDDHVRGLLRDLTGAEDALVVNNNAGAVLLMLNTMAQGREVIVSRGELVEIGGAFRMPDIMARAGARLREVGTTNRTHPADYEAAIGPETAALMRAHPSNYRIEGFAAAVPAPVLAGIAHKAGLPFLDDLGSGALVDLGRFGLPREVTVRQALEAGADLVTFSGDKLLGGPQAGLVAGRGALVRRLAANPMKRALRMDKLRLAALEAVLRLYLDPDRLAERLPALRLLTRKPEAIRAAAEVLAHALRRRFPDHAVEVRPCHSQIGSGALPVDLLPSFAATVGGGDPEALAACLRDLPRPVIGRIAHDNVWLDCRCLEDAETPVLLGQLAV